MASYTPLQVKMGITGYGRAEKKQIQQMVQRILKLKEIPKPDDAADALAICLTHINTLTSQIGVVSIKSLKSVSLPSNVNKLSLEEYRKMLKK